MFKSDNKTPVANICVISFCWNLNVFHLDISIYLWCVGRFGTICLILKRCKTPMEDSACKLAKINTPPWVFFTFFKLYKWYQIAQCITFEQCFFFHSDPPCSAILLYICCYWNHISVHIDNNIICGVTFFGCKKTTE